MDVFSKKFNIAIDSNKLSTKLHIMTKVSKFFFYVLLAIAFNANAQAINQSEILEMRAVRAEYQNALKKFCHLKAPYDQEFIEKIGMRFSIDPRTISFARVYLTEDTLSRSNEPYGVHNQCQGVFYTPKGPWQCELIFSNSGRIMGCGPVGYSRSYTTELFSSYLNKYMKIYFSGASNKSPEEKPAQFDPKQHGCTNAGAGAVKPRCALVA